MTSPPAEPEVYHLLINLGQHIQESPQAIQPHAAPSQQPVEILAEADPASISAKSERQVALTTVLVSALLGMLGFLGGGV